MIEISNLVKTFGATRAVDGISFKVAKGEVLGFLGPNGAGKTTTMKVITGFYDPNEGQVLVAGLDTVKNSLRTRRLIGYLPETVPLYDDMKVYEYLKFVAEARDLETDKILPRLREVVEKCGLQKVIGKNIDELSKGFRQRVGLAQAIMHDPDILILDEPTTGLDPNQIVEIRELIKAIGQEKTVLFSTHILAEAEATCDRVVIINKGKIVAEGQPQELMDKMANGQNIHLHVKGPMEQVVVVLKNISGVRSLDSQAGDGDQVGVYNLQVDVAKDVREAVSVALMEHRWPILEFKTREINLEDIFRELTK
jgi:ABC-2 type transport system ATP-binding protein